MSLDLLSFAMGKASAPPSGDITLKSLTVTENNKTYRSGQGEAFSSVRAAIPEIELEEKTVTENGEYEPPEGKGFGKVNVAVPQGVFPSGTKTINRNGEYNVTEYEKVDVNIKPTYSVEGNTLKISGMVESGVLYL